MSLLKISSIFSICASILFISASTLFQIFWTIFFKYTAYFIFICLVLWGFIMLLHLLHVSLSFHFVCSLFSDGCKVIVHLWSWISALWSFPDWGVGGGGGRGGGWEHDVGRFSFTLAPKLLQGMRVIRVPLCAPIFPSVKWDERTIFLTRAVQRSTRIWHNWGYWLEKRWWSSHSLLTTVITRIIYEELGASTGTHLTRNCLAWTACSKPVP